MSKHRFLAANLRQRIEEKMYPIGGLLPTEMNLAASFGVSRATVRQALAALRAEGLIAAHPGRGTKVIASRGAALGSFSASFQSMNDLMRMGEATRFKVVGKRCESKNEALAETLGFGRGRRFLRVDALRIGEDGAPFVKTTLYLDALYAPVAAELDGARESAYALLSKKYGISVGRVAQEISAGELSAASARILGGARGSPTLLVLRRYYADDGKLFMVARSLCAPGLRAAVTLFAPQAAAHAAAA
jgi:DNA-binding GntR family transcriptional regulator